MHKQDLLALLYAAARRLWLGLRLRALLLVLLAPVACAAPRSAADALTSAGAAHNLAVVALEIADAAAVAWIDAGAPDAEAARVVAALERAQAVLVRAHAALEKGDDALADVRSAVALLRVAASLLGERAPPGLATALDEAAELIGGTP